jgi:ppGpp synthetase/RelA/SpoT-type nucleotidyltranferase
MPVPASTKKSVVFYLNRDIDRFAVHIGKEFEVVKYNPKFSLDGYNAAHVVVKIDKDRLGLTEYQKFVGLKCEIQLTTVLFHAWSELAHDTIYKPEEGLRDFDHHTYESLKKRFSDTMKDHIKEAQYTFDFIATEMDKVKEGKRKKDIRPVLPPERNQLEIKQ